MARPSRDGFPVVVHIMLVRSREVFLLRRAATGFMDGYFGLPGGHQQHGESVSDAARRECQEEAGVVPLDLQPRLALPYVSGRHQGLNFVFATHSWAGKPHIAEPTLFDACRWAVRSALPIPVAPWLKEALHLPAGQWYKEFHWSD